jgi:predicted ester cyclase
LVSVPGCAPASELPSSIERELRDERLAMVDCTVTGTHRDTFRDIPATGRTIRSAVAFSVDVAEGKITTWRSYFDPAAMVRQLSA